MTRVTLHFDAMDRIQRFASSETPIGVRVSNDDVQRAATYEVVLREGDRVQMLQERHIKAGESAIEEIPMDGGEIINTGRVDIHLEWPVERPDPM